MSRRATWTFLLLDAFFINFAAGLIGGSLPLALASEGTSTALISFVMGVGATVATMVSIPMGWLTDKVGRLYTMRVSVVLTGLSMLTLSFAHGAFESALIVAVRAFPLVAFGTAELAYAVGIAPEGRRISSATSLGMIANLSVAISPAFAVWLWQHGVGRQQYAYGALLVLLGGALLLSLPKERRLRPFRRPRTILMRSAWLPALGFCVATMVQSGVITSLAVITFYHRGIVNPAILFTAISTTVLILRYPAARCVDVYGPRLVAIPAVCLQSIGCILTAFASNAAGTVGAGIVLGTAWAAMFPICVALLFEKSSRMTRGRAMGAMGFGMNMGAMCGALIATLSVVLGPGFPLAMFIAAITGPCALIAVLRSPVSSRSSAAFSKESARLRAPCA